MTFTWRCYACDSSGIWDGGVPGYNASCPICHGEGIGFRAFVSWFFWRLNPKRRYPEECQECDGDGTVIEWEPDDPVPWSLDTHLRGREVQVLCPTCRGSGVQP